MSDDPRDNWCQRTCPICNDEDDGTPCHTCDSTGQEHYCKVCNSAIRDLRCECVVDHSKNRSIVGDKMSDDPRENWDLRTCSVCEDKLSAFITCSVCNNTGREYYCRVCDEVVGNQGCACVRKSVVDYSKTKQINIEPSDMFIVGAMMKHLSDHREFFMKDLGFGERFHDVKMKIMEAFHYTRHLEKTDGQR